jgi:NAD dependent epimerase/dehydratase family enzyme
VIEELKQKIKENTPPQNKFQEFLVKHWEMELVKLEKKINK